MKRLFLVGCPRSGTTLLQSLIGAHRDVLTFTETGFFTRFFHHRLNLVYRLKPGLDRRIVDFLAENNFSNHQVPALATGLMSAGKAVRQARFCLEMLDEMARESHKSAWLEKTPHNVLRMPLLERAAPNAQFIHIVRAPLATVKSLKAASSAWNLPLDWQGAAKQWVQATTISIRAAQTKSERVVIYEELLQRPHEIVAQIFQKIDLPQEGYDENAYRDVARRVIAPREIWKHNNVREIGSTEANDQEIPAEVIKLLTEAKLYERACKLSQL